MTIPLWLGRIVCTQRGHKRHKRVDAGVGEYVLRCPRCGNLKPGGKLAPKAAA